jgi:radical SAM superfamily enzyme YgiQ (UPF0313 family)/ubiquinone/menaquinone biosynthesis C-methylase UbiE
MFDKKKDIILFYTPEAAVEPHMAAQCILARTLKELGYRVAMTHCSGIFSRCPAMDMFHLPHNYTLDEKHRVCATCSRSFFDMVGKYELDFIELSDFISTDELSSIIQIINSKADDIFSFKYDSYALGTISAHDVILALKQYSFENMTDLQMHALITYTQASLQSYVITHNLINVFPVRRFVRFNDYSLLLGASFAALKHSIPVISTTLAPHKTADFQRISFTSSLLWRDAFYRAIDVWKYWRNLSLSPIQVSDVVDDMIERYSGLNFHTFSPAKTFTELNLIEKFEFSTNRKTVVAYTSSKDELNAGMMLMEGVGLSAPDIRLTFPDQITWLQSVVNYVENSANLQLIVRIHPREGGVKGNKIESQHLFELKRNFGQSFNHCRFVWPSDQTSSYDLFEIADLALISWSTIGLELARLGIPVLAMNKGTSYPGDDFIEWVETPKGYFIKFEELLARKPSLQTLAHAFRFYTCFNLSHSLNLSDIIHDSGVTFDFKGLPPFNLTRESKVIEEVLVGGRNILDITLERQQLIQSNNIKNEELTALKMQIKRLIHFVCTGHDLNYDFPFQIIEQGGYDHININGADTAFVRTIIIDNKVIEYVPSCGVKIRKNSVLCRRLTQLYLESERMALDTASCMRKRKTSINNTFESIWDEINQEIDANCFPAVIDLYEQLLKLFPSLAPTLYLKLYDIYQMLPNQDRYTLYVSRFFDFGIQPTDKVLDIGSGNLPFPLATHLADLALTNDSVGRAGVPFKHLDGKPVYECDLENLPFGDHEFDFVYCSHVLEHVENPEKACTELMRVGKRGYIETPNRGKDLWLNTAKISNHKWAVEKWNETLIFTEYTPRELEGLDSDILMQMHCAPQNEREKAFSALIYLKADLVNVMHYWENNIVCEVRRSEKSDVGATLVTSSPRPIESSKKALCLFINTYYDAFLSEAYSRHAGLGDKPYKEQLQQLVECLFGDSDFYSKGLKRASWNADDLIVNNIPLQQVWAQENGCDCEGLALVVEQVKQARPDCVYLQNLGLGTKELLAAIRPYTELIVGQIAYPLPEQTDLSGFDIIFSSFPHFVDRFRSAGITAYYQTLAFEPRVLKSLTKFAYDKRPVECSFVGGISTMHGKAYQLLETLATNVPIHFWGYGAETLPLDSSIRACHHGEAWGTEMFYLLGASKITINRHIDVAENNANNMRLFEATGCGALLITDYKNNLHELFEIGKEVVVYHSPEECIELVRYYLAHTDEAEIIAKAGQARTLRDHTYEKRMKQTAKILSRHLRYRREQGTLVMPERISDSYRTLEPGDVTSVLESAWKNPEIPLQQRALVQQQLQEMYRGNTPLPFKILSDILSPLVYEKISILEIGCASGYYYEVLEYLLQRQITYTGVDYSASMIDLAKDYYPDAGFITADGASLPIADKSFRIVISGCVLLHTPDYALHIAETARVAEQWIVVHRTPVYRTRPTTCSSKMAYGVETVEFRFNEQELLNHFSRHGFVLKQAVTYDDRTDRDDYEVSYLLERVKPTVSVPQPRIAASTKIPGVAFGRKGPVVLVSRAIAFTFPLSYAYLAGQLRTQGEDVRVLFKDTPAQLLVKQIMDLNPLIVGFGNLYPELAETKTLIQMLDAAGRKFPVVIGGQMVSPTPEFAVRITGADFGVIGEGELILSELVQRLRNGLDVSDLKGLVIRDGAHILNNGSGAYIENLSTGLPPIPYDLFPTEQWLPIGAWYAKNLPVPHWKIDDRVINVHGGRGCPFKCNFCYHHSKARYRDISVMMEEAQEALVRFDANMLYFSDDLNIATPKRARQLIEAIGRLDRPISFQTSTRFDILARFDDELLRDLKRVGCRSMGLGLESGSDRILKIIGKNCTSQQIEEGLERLRQVGIYPTVSIMLGQHTETLEEAKLSIELMQRTIQKDPYLNYAFTLATPFPGSALYNLIFEKGYLKDDQEFYDRYFSTSGEFKQVVNLSAMTDTEVMAAFHQINYLYDGVKQKWNRMLGLA